MLSLLSVFGFAGSARAEQFIAADVTYTHSAETTSDSHYRVSPRAGSPTNWKSPVDYSKGSARVLLEVKSKPADTETKFQICFEATPTYACTEQSPTYTKTGKYEWTTPFSRFWSPEGMAVDWSKGVVKVALILKDTSNGKPQGDPKYVPTDLHVEVAILSEGATYVAPPRLLDDGGAAPQRDGGSQAADGGARVDAAVAQDAGQSGLVPRDAPLPPTAMADASSSGAGARDSGAASTGSQDASMTAGSSDGGSGADVADGAREPRDDEESGCALAESSLASLTAWVMASVLAFGVRRRRRTRQR
jgi:hypothetical protein